MTTETLSKYEQQMADAERRLSFEKIDLKAEIEKDWSDRIWCAWERSAYRVSVDGIFTAWLVCSGSYSNTHWTVFNIDRSKECKIWRQRSRYANLHDFLRTWLADDYDPEWWPNQDVMNERAETARLIREKREADTARRRAEQKAAAQQSRKDRVGELTRSLEAATTARDNLTILQSNLAPMTANSIALEYALGLIRKRIELEQEEIDALNEKIADYDAEQISSVDQ